MNENIYFIAIGGLDIKSTSAALFLSSSCINIHTYVHGMVTITKIFPECGVDIVYLLYYWCKEIYKFLPSLFQVIALVSKLLYIVLRHK